MSYLNPIWGTNFRDPVNDKGAKKKKYKPLKPLKKNPLLNVDNGEPFAYDIAKMRARFAKNNALVKNFHKDKPFSGTHLKMLKLMVKHMEAIKSQDSEGLRRLYQILPQDVLRIITDDNPDRF